MGAVQTGGPLETTGRRARVPHLAPRAAVLRTRRKARAGTPPWPKLPCCVQGLLTHSPVQRGGMWLHFHRLH